MPIRECALLAGQSFILVHFSEEFLIEEITNIGSSSDDGIQDWLYLFYGLTFFRFL